MLNCIIIQGRLAKDVEVRQTNSGTPVASFSLAVQRGRKAPDGDYPTDWVDCVAWSKSAEFASKYFHRGDMMLVRGRLESRDWEDKNGQKRRSWEVQVDSMDFCGSKSGGNSQPASDGFADIGGSEDDVPF